jgi:hypothetical protein
LAKNKNKIIKLAIKVKVGEEMVQYEMKNRMSINDCGKGEKVTFNLPTQRHISLLRKLVCLFVLLCQIDISQTMTPLTVLLVLLLESRQ